MTVIKSGGAVIRQATEADLPAVARLHRLVRQTCLPFLPDLHTVAEDLEFFRVRVFHDCEIWVAGDDVISGFCACRDGWIDHLYITPAQQGLGLGSALLAKVKERQIALRLWVFQRNSRAIRFYEARGFDRIDRTDGAGNEEREPDALYEWTAERRVGSEANREGA